MCSTKTFPIIFGEILLNTSNGYNVRISENPALMHLEYRQKRKKEKTNQKLSFIVTPQTFGMADKNISLDVQNNFSSHDLVLGFKDPKDILIDSKEKGIDFDSPEDSEVLNIKDIPENVGQINNKKTEFWVIFGIKKNRPKIDSKFFDNDRGYLSIRY